MARPPSRASGPAGTRLDPRSFVASAIVLACVSCASYEPAPLDVREVLRELDARAYEPPESSGPRSATPSELAAFAVLHAPALAAARAELGVARAELEEAGRVADPELGWDAMDVIASELVTGSSSAVDALSGLGLMFELPRPDELGAERGAALWRMREVRARVAEAEWELARDVRVACEDVREADELVAQSDALQRIAERTREHFERARQAGAATAIEASLAEGGWLAIRAERVRREASARAARRRLSALLGLPPDFEIELEFESGEEALPELDASADELSALALARRPDVAAWIASYRAAEEELRLAVARQFPLVSIGTGIAVRPGLFRAFGRLAVDTARARREAVRRSVESRVHELRRDVHAARAAWAAARAELEFVRGELLPNAEASLERAGAAVEHGEATLLAILEVQRGFVATQTREVELRAEVARWRWRLASAAGLVFPPDADVRDGVQGEPGTEVER